MREETLSRRAVLGAGMCTLTASYALPSGVSSLEDTGLSAKHTEIVRRYYAVWESKDWRLMDPLLAPDFTFTSANNDDHISKSAFKARCWDTQVGFVDHFDLKHVIGSGNDVFVLYVCRTKNSGSFHNVEYLKLRDAKLESIEVYFGAQSSFASSVGPAHD